MSICRTPKCESASTTELTIAGDAPKQVLVRGIGPGLTGFGVNGALPNPALKVYRGSELVAQNDDWTAEAAAAFSRWREAIAVRPRKGWRPNTAYTVTIAPGLSDLGANATTQPIELRFSTGATIPTRTIRGTAFDWVGQKVAAGGRIEATLGNDTTLRWVARVDSTGVFTLRSLPDGPLHLRAFIDANNNRILDRTERWDTATVSAADTALREIYVFEHDSLGPSLSDITRTDSSALKIRFTRPLLPWPGAAGHSGSSPR